MGDVVLGSRTGAPVVVVFGVRLVLGLGYRRVVPSHVRCHDGVALGSPALRAARTVLRQGIALLPSIDRLSGAAKRKGSDAPAGGAPPARQYSAFLSYSRAVDGKLAPALATALRVFAKPWYRRRMLRVFRDDDSLSANPGLWSSIQAGLDGSEFFVLLASPKAAASPWVAKEVAHWLAHRPVERVLIVVTDGELTWDGDKGDFDAAGTDCLPPGLYGAFSEEPRWADLRKVRDEDHLSPRSPAFREVVADLVAALRHVSKDEIVGEDLRQHRRTRAVVTAGIVSLMVLATVASLTAVVATRRGHVADEQRRLAEDGRRTAISRQLVSTAASTVAHDPRTALRLAVAAQRIRPGAETRAGLYRALTATSFAGRLPGSARTPQSFFSDGRAVVVSDDDRAVIWDLHGAEPVELASIPTAGQPALSPDGRTLIVYPPLFSSDDQRWIEAWDVRDRRRPAKLWTTPTTVNPTTVTFSADSRLLAIEGYTDVEPMVVVWDVGDPRLPVPRAEWVTEASSLAFAPDNRTLAVGGGRRTDGFDADMTLTLWDVGTAAAATRLSSSTFTSGGRVTSLRFSASGTLLAASGSGPQGNTDVATILIDVTDRNAPRQLAQPFKGNRTNVVTSALDPTSTVLATSGGPDRASTLWDIRTPDRPVQLDSLTGHVDHVHTMSFSPDGTTLMTTDATGDTYLWQVPGRGSPRPAGHVTGALASPDSPVTLSALAVRGTMLITTGEGSGLDVWTVDDPADPRRVATIEDGGEPFTHGVVAISSDERLVAIGVSTQLASAVYLWNLADRANPLLSAIVPARSVGRVGALSFAPDGRTLVVAGSHRVPSPSGKGVVEVLDVKGDVPGAQFSGFVLPEAVTTAEFSPDGKLLAVGGGDEYTSDDAMVALWDLSDRTHPHETGASLSWEWGHLSALAFSPDSRTFAVVGGSGDHEDPSGREIVLWDITNPETPGRVGQVYAGHQGDVTDIAFAPDGRTMASTGQEAEGGAASLLLWDLTDFPRVHPIGPLSYGNETLVGTLAFGGDGRWLVTGGFAPTPRLSATLWDLSGMLGLRDDDVTRACVVADGGLDPEEWRIHVPDLDYEATCPS